MIDLAGGEPRDQVARLVEHARGVGHENEFLGLEDFGELACHEVCIDVVGFAVGSRPNRRNDWDEAALEQRGDHLRIHRLDLADLPNVGPRCLIGRLQHELSGSDETTILAGEAHGLAPGMVDELHNFFVHLACEHHLHDVHGLGIGDPHALHELALLAHAAEQVFDLGAATVNHHQVDAHELEQHHISGKALLEGFVRHGVAAVLHHHRLAMEAANVGQGLHQRGDLLTRGQI